MSTMIEVEKLALDLPEQERATLAANLLNSLPGIGSDEDEGIAEALRRDAEIEADPVGLFLLRNWILTSRVGVADASGFSSQI